MKISIIVPIYNAIGTIGRCVESVLAQGKPDIEIILVDDGSNDGSGNVIDEFGKKYSNICVIHQKNQGVSAARNIGLEASTGDWVTFLDADDYLREDFCATLSEVAESHNCDAVLTCGAWKEDCNYSKEVEVIKNKEQLIADCIAYRTESYLFNVDAPWGKLFRRSIIQENNIQFPIGLRRSEDAVFCATFFEYTNKIASFNWAGYVHIEEQGSLCRSYTPDATIILVDVLKELEAWVECFHPNEKMFEQAIYYRVLPGLNEIENVYLRHPENRCSRIKRCKVYQDILRIPTIRKALKRLNREEVSYRPYLRRLRIYRMNLGFILIVK